MTRGRGERGPTGSLEALDRGVDVVGVETEVRDAEVARSDRLGLLGAVHFEELDIGSGSDLDHRLPAHDRSWVCADGPLELGPLPRWILRSRRTGRSLGRRELPPEDDFAASMSGTVMPI
jgi:hypothetical protein